MTASAGGLSFALAHLVEIDSTNAEAMRRALAGETGPLWVLADRQTAGRGRSGRAWVSAAGNLFASLLVASDYPIVKAGQLSLVAGVAAVDALRKAGALASGAELRLKWPNDILIGAEKTGGILVESSTRGAGDGRVTVIGVGLNLASAPPALEGRATFLAAHGLTLSPRAALCFLAEAMDAWLETWNGGEGFALVRAAWLQRAGAPGEPLTVHAAEGPIEGRFVGLDADGALVIADADGARRHFTYGDVTLSGTLPDKKANEDDKDR
jgi:BirA family biotin operon repressor/biotin-[acetyl-CoA-carboxylase] ligase